MHIKIAQLALFCLVFMTTGLLFSTNSNDISGLDFDNNIMQVDPDDDDDTGLDDDFDESPNLTPINNIQITNICFPFGVYFFMNLHIYILKINFITYRKIL